MPISSGDVGVMAASRSGWNRQHSSTYTNAPWYPYRDAITKVIIDYGVENIGSYAFYKYHYLESLEIGKSVSEIGQWSFVQTDLGSLHIPSTVEYIGPAAFRYCDGIKEVTFENSLKISADTFGFCDIAPNQMNDTISATLFATYDGVEYSSETKKYSVATYCYNMLVKCSGDEYAEF